uniref:Uncharacterized protein n=1 Tax=Ciona intestinalis TaxID=7719 RepID=H2XPY8_CIOIN
KFLLRTVLFKERQHRGKNSSSFGYESNSGSSTLIASSRKGQVSKLAFRHSLSSTGGKLLPPT